MMSKTTRLRDKTKTKDRRLDRLKDFDQKSWEHPIRSLISTTDSKVPRSRTHRLLVWNDQGEEGACVGFGCGHELASSPVNVKGVDAKFSRERIYWEAQKIDQWVGGSYPGAKPQYEGTSVLAGMKVIQSLGFIESYRWAFGVKDLVLALGYVGPAVLGLAWFEGMFDTDEAGYIHPTGEIAGGHCILARAVRIVWKDKKASRTWDNVDWDKSWILLHNSWGKDWGVDGTAKVSLRDMDTLLKEDGEAAVPLNRNMKLRLAA